MPTAISSNKVIREELLALADEGYRNFQSSLMPTVDKERVIGVRVPAIRALARRVYSEKAMDAFLRELPHKYFEEDMLHGILLGYISDYDALIAELDRFLPYVDCWAVTDMMSFKAFSENRERAEKDIVSYLALEHPYTVRFAICMLMKYFLKEEFDEKHLSLVADVKSEHYYVNMMRAWYFAEALAWQERAALSFIEKRVLDTWTHNKAISKAIESRKINDEKKKYLRSLKIK